MTRTLVKILRFIGLAVLAVLWLLPMYTILATSFKTPHEVALHQYMLPPESLQISNYVAAFQILKPSLVNSTIVSVSATVLSVLLGSWAGYFLSRLRFRYSNTVFFITSIATFLPYQIILIPFTQFMAATNLINTRLGLIVAYTILNTPMTALITATFFQAIPDELQDAAAVDGCGPVGFYWRILFPVAWLGIVSTTILLITMIWNEFLIATTFTQGPAAQMATPVLAGLRGNYAELWNIQMAGSVLTSIPPLVIFILLGRYYVAGLKVSSMGG
jgi:glucose/mannose transport system permease protein